MTQEKSGTYRGATREEAERAYHTIARAGAEKGWVPTSETWTTALGQHVLTVRYIYAPDDAPSVLAALGQVPQTAAATGKEETVRGPEARRAELDQRLLEEARRRESGWEFRRFLILFLLGLGLVVTGAQRDPALAVVGVAMLGLAVYFAFIRRSAG